MGVPAIEVEGLPTSAYYLCIPRKSALELTQWLRGHVLLAALPPLCCGRLAQCPLVVTLPPPDIVAVVNVAFALASVVGPTYRKHPSPAFIALGASALASPGRSKRFPHRFRQPRAFERSQQPGLRAAPTASRPQHRGTVLPCQKLLCCY